MTYPLSTTAIRAKRRQRVADKVRTSLARLSWERQEILDEYRKVSDTYARHLERLNAKARRNSEAMADLAAELETFEEINPIT